MTTLIAEDLVRPAVDSTHEAAVRRELGDVLLRGVRPAERTAALVATTTATSGG